MLVAGLVAALVSNASPHLVATKTTAAPVLDGRLDDGIWELAASSNGFRQKFPHDGAAPSETTTVRVLYDDTAVYVGIDCPQREAPIVPRLTRRDRNAESDWISINLDTRADGKTAVEFLVNASGVLVDGARSNDVDYSVDWDENWEAQTWIGEAGWSAELRIPLRILRFARADVQSWGFQVRRYVSARQETDEWAYIPRSDAAEVSRYGRLDGLEHLKPSSVLELRPSALVRVRSRAATTDTVGTGTDVRPSAGLDLKWHPTQDLTVDATFNPDFAQVEADQVVLNLSTFEVFKPEKRPFFLEGADLVAPRLNLPLVYTKRIGRAPDLPQLRGVEKLVDLPEPSPIYGATKLTGRLSERLSVGTLSALTGRNDVDVQLDGGARQSRLIEPLTSYNVLRLKRDVGDNAHIGLLATATSRGEDTGAYAPSLDHPGMVVCPNQTRADGTTEALTVARGSRCFHDAYVIGVDARLRHGDWITTGQIVATAIEHGPTRTVVDGTRIGAGDVAPASDFYVGKEGGKHFVTWTWFGNAARKVDFNDLGFMWRQNVRYVLTGMEYRTLDPWWETLETHHGFEVNAADNLSGLRVIRDASAYTIWKLASFWESRLAVGVHAQRFDDREVGDGTALERDTSEWARFRLLSDPRARVAFMAAGQYTWVRAGFAASADATVTWRVLPQLDIELSPQASVSGGEPRYATDGSVSGAHLYGPLEAKNVSATLRATYTFLPRLSLMTYAQMFLASGHYGALSAAPAGGTDQVVRLSQLTKATETGGNPDFQQGAMNVNASLRWEYRLGSLLSFVYARAQAPAVTLGATENGSIDLRSIGRAPAVDLFYVKMSYFWG